MNNLKRRGQSLVGVLVSVFLMIGLAVFFLMPRGGNDGTPQKSTIKRSMDMAEGTALTSNISQIQQGISMYKSDNDGKAPASLDELKRYLKYPPEMWENPLDKKPLVYDPASGTICAEGPGCPAPGGVVSNPVAPGANPPPPVAVSPNLSTPGGMTSKIPAPGAGAAEALNDN